MAALNTLAPASIAKRTVSIEEAGRRAGLCRSRLNDILDRGEISAIKLLDRRLVVVASLEAFLARQRERASQDRRVRVPPPDRHDSAPPMFGNDLGSG